MHASPDQVLQVQALAGDIVLCSWARQFALTVPLSTQGRVVQKAANANPVNQKLTKVNQSINFLYENVFSCSHFVSSSKLKDKHCEQKTSLKSCKTELKILANPGLA